MIVKTLCTHCWPVLLAILLSGASAAVARADEAARGLKAQRDELHQKYVALLSRRADALADTDPAAARQVRAWAVQRRPGRNYLFVAPPDDERPLALRKDDELRKLQQFYAGHLMALAQRALRDQQRALAYQLANEALRADPENELAQAVVNASAHEPSRPAKVPAGWEIETQHFEITTNHTPEAARQTGRRLEELHAVWRQLFADYWFTQAELERRFAGKASQLVEPNHKVMLFADKQQYVDYLKRDEPGIAVSLGYYAERPRTAYFFADDRTLTTQFHEATHQLFHERQRRGRAAGIDDNFWAVEGVANYMESLQKGDGYFVVGGPGAYRLQFARYRALTDGFYVPLARLTAMGRDDFKQSGDDLPRLYSQAAGLTHFFMDSEGGKHRDAFVQYLDAVYRDKADATTLARLTGASYKELDRQYADFLRAGDDDLAALIPGENVERLYLGRTRITDGAVKQIASVSGLERLDVGYCRITDAGVKQLPASETLIQLNLEHTQITDAALAHVARMSQLRELDLSGCRITDEGLKSIAALEHLEILWLTDTPVTDAGLRQLYGLKNLKFADVGGSRVTADGWAALKRALPDVKRDR